MAILQKSGVLETIESHAAGILARISDDDVIDKVYIHYPGRFPELPRHLNIGLAGGWIPAGMVMEYDDGG